MIGMILIIDMLRTVIYLAIVILVLASPQDDLTNKVRALQVERNLKGIQLQISSNAQLNFNINLGIKNEKQEAVNNSTVYRIASLSKSFSSVALLQLVQQNKLRLNQSLSEIFGYTIKNPNFAEDEITLEMVLSHQSSLIECEPFYSNFLVATVISPSGYEVPDIKQILLQGGKYYNDCLYSKDRRPGQYFDYVNLNFVIAGTIVEIVSGKRFDAYLRENILSHLSVNQAQIATFDPSTLSNTNNLGVIYRGSEGKWTPTCDNYPNGKINPKNLTGYRIGSNGGVFGPQGSMRASTSHLTNYAIMLVNKGVTKQGKRIISQKSVQQLIKPRYHYHGPVGGELMDFHQYGLGLYTTSYRVSDIVISHEVVRGHIGDAYGLLSGLYFWKNHTFTYIISGALNGYIDDQSTIYEEERVMLHKAAEQYVNALQKQIIRMQ